MEQGMEERRLSIYLGNRNALEILKLRGLYRTRISPPPPPPPISRCIQFYEDNRFALGFAPKKIHRALLYRGREFNEVSCHVAHTNGRRDFSSIFWRWSNSRVNVIYTCLSSLLLFLFLFIPFYICLFFFLRKRKLEGGSIVTERGSLFFSFVVWKLTFNSITCVSMILRIRGCIWIINILKIASQLWNWNTYTLCTSTTFPIKFALPNIRITSITGNRIILL